jgi:hypothetical protein
MPINHQTCNHDQLLDLCAVDRFADYQTGAKDFAIKIFALFATERDQEQIKSKLDDIIREIGKISIGQALRQLNNVATIGPEFDGNHTGIDALAYHLSGPVCRQTITTLQSILKWFEEDAKQHREDTTKIVIKSW